MTLSRHRTRKLLDMELAAVLACILMFDVRIQAMKKPGSFAVNNLSLRSRTDCPQLQRHREARSMPICRVAYGYSKLRSRELSIYPNFQKNYQKALCSPRALSIPSWVVSIWFLRKRDGIWGNVGGGNEQQVLLISLSGKDYSGLDT